MDDRLKQLSKLQRHMYEVMRGHGWMTRPQINRAIGRPSRTLVGGDLKALETLVEAGLVVNRPIRETPIYDVLEYKVKENQS